MFEHNKKIKSFNNKQFQLYTFLDTHIYDYATKKMNLFNEKHKEIYITLG